jgi:DNA mismatch endonuclease (patch repair protein)
MKPGDPNWPAPISAATSNVMRGNRGRDTTPETAVRSLVHRRGLRFRTRYTIRLDDGRWTRPDMVFTRSRVAVYVDGCFWHGCPDHGTRPTSNADYWSPKLANNVVRDLDTNAQLSLRGWRVLRAWEHQDPELVAELVAHVVAERR